MNKNLKIIIWSWSLYIGLFLTPLTIMISKFNWSWQWLVWLLIIPLIATGLAVWGVKLSKGTKKEEVEEESPDISIEKQKEFVMKWIMSNKDSPIDQPMIKFVLPFTPKQEGDNKLSVNKVKVEGYWGSKHSGFDILFLAIDRKKEKIIMYNTYSKKTEDPEDKIAEKDFDERLSRSVTNPEKTEQVETIITDPMTGSARRVIKKTPIHYLKQAEERKEARQQAEEEGAGEE